MIFMFVRKAWFMQKFFMWIMFVIPMLFIFTNYALPVKMCFNNVHSSEVRKDIDLLEEVSKLITENFYGDVTQTKLTEGAISGMFNSLDSYSTYLNPSDYMELQSSAKGKFGGIGVEGMHDKLGLRVVSVLEGTPSSFTDLRSGDIIVSANDTNLGGKNLYEMVKLLRGPLSDAVVIQVLRGGEVLDFTMKREIIEIQSVTGGLIGDGILYCKISSFANNTKSQMLELINGIDLSNVSGVILDLRSNPGGLLDKSIDIAGLFIKKDSLVVSTKGKISKCASEYKTSSIPKLGNIPIVVLVNHGSASASEILAVALQYHNGAHIMGEWTFGKGTVQVILELPNKVGAAKMTVAEYFTPSGSSVDNIGVKPDIEIKISDKGYESMLECRKDRLNNIKSAKCKEVFGNFIMYDTQLQGAFDFFQQSQFSN